MQSIRVDAVLKQLQDEAVSKAVKTRLNTNDIKTAKKKQAGRIKNNGIVK